MPRIRLSLLGIVLASFPISPQALAEDDTASQEAGLRQIVDKLPDILKDLKFPPLKVPGREFAGPDPRLGYSKLRIARLIAKDAAKITLSFRVPSDNGKGPDYEYGTLSIYLSWYKSSWTCTRYERTSWCEDFASQDGVLALFAQIDETTNEK